MEKICEFKFFLILFSKHVHIKSNKKKTNTN